VVADEEIRADLALGDNDYLATLLVRLVRADLLVILSTVDGLRAPHPGGTTRRVACLESVNRHALSLVDGTSGARSRGGMGSKLKAARDAARAGCATVIADGRAPDILGRILRGENVGTLILASAL